MSVEVLYPRDVHTTLNYYTPLNSAPPYNYNPSVPLPPSTPRSNVGREAHPVVVHDARAAQAADPDAVGLDKTGFEFVQWPSKEAAFVDEERIKDVYYKEVEEILRERAGAKRVFIFDHTIRRSKPDDSAGANRGPALLVHVDQTFAAGLERVRYHLPEDAERLLKGRVRIINVWRPIENPVAHHPLAVADYRSIDPAADLVSTDLIYPHRTGSTFSVKYNPTHKWWYLADQTPEEVILIKCFDSDEGAARLTPHTAFADATSPAGAPNRQSIEVRALVFDRE